MHTKTSRRTLVTTWIHITTPMNVVSCFGTSALVVLKFTFLDLHTSAIEAIKSMFDEYDNEDRKRSCEKIVSPRLRRTSITG